MNPLGYLVGKLEYDLISMGILMDLNTALLYLGGFTGFLWRFYWILMGFPLRYRVIVRSLCRNTVLRKSAEILECSLSFLLNCMRHPSEYRNVV